MSLDLALLYPPGLAFGSAVSVPRPTVFDVTWQADGGSFHLSDHEVVAYNADAATFAGSLDSEYPFGSPWSVVDNGSSGNMRAYRCTSGVNGSFSVTVTNIDLYTTEAVGDNALTVTTQGSDAVAGVKEKFTLNVGPDDGTLSVGNGSLTADASATGGQITSVNSPAGFTAVSGGVGSAFVTFEADAVGSVTDFSVTSDTTNNGTDPLVIDVQGADAISAVAEVTSFHRGSANAGTMAVGGGSFAYNASNASVATAVAGATGRTYTAGAGSGTSGSPWTLTDDAPGAVSDLSITTNALELRTSAASSLVLTTVTAGSPAPIFYATFVGSNGTTLNGLTPDIGPNNLVVRSGAWTIQDNRASCGTAGIVTADIGSSNYVLTQVVRAASGAGAVGIGVVVRYGTGDGYFYMVNVEVTANRFRLYRYDGSFTMLQSATVGINADTDYIVKVTVSGSTITATLDGANQIQQTGATQNATSTHIGIRGDTSGDLCRVETAYATQ